MNDASLFANLGRLTAASFTLKEIEALTGGTTFASRLAGNRTVWSVRVNGETFPLERETPISQRFTISDPDLCRMAEGEDQMRDYAEAQETRAWGPM